jgi:hypothetical protein
MIYPPTLSDDGERGFDATDNATNGEAIINLFAEVYLRPGSRTRPEKPLSQRNPRSGGLCSDACVGHGAAVSVCNCNRKAGQSSARQTYLDEHDEKDFGGTHHPHHGTSITVSFRNRFPFRTKGT